MSLTDSLIISELNKYRYKNAADGWTIRIETGVFNLRINNVDGDGDIEQIENCKEVKVQLFDYEEMPPAEELTISPITVGDKTFVFDVTCFPHKPINPQTDPRFQDQPWASKIKWGTGLGWEGEVTIQELCDIIRYCVKLPNLQVFL